MFSERRDPRPDRVIVLGELHRRAESRGKVSALLASLYPPQLDLVTKLTTGGVRRAAVLCGRRAGKSWAIAVLLVLVCLSRPHSRCIWLGITQKNVKRFALDILYKIRRLFGISMEFNGSTLTWRFQNWSTIELDGADNVAKESEKYTGASYDVVIVDECGSFGVELLRYLWESIFRPALMDRRGVAVLAGSPRHIHAGLFFMATRGELADWTPFKWSCLDNKSIAENIAAEIAEMLAANPNVESTTAFRREILGEWCPDDTAFVYGDISRNIVHEPFMPTGECKYITGADVGFEDEFALVQLAWQSGCRELHVVESFSAPGLLTGQMAAACRTFADSYPFTRFVFDPAWKTTVQDLRVKYRIPIQIAKKLRKQDAIRTLVGELSGVAHDGGQRRILIHMPACAPLVSEASVLPWRVTGTGVRIEDPTFPNHCCDAMLYAWREVVDWDREQASEETYSQRTVRILTERANRSAIENAL